MSGPMIVRPRKVRPIIVNREKSYNRKNVNLFASELQCHVLVEKGITMWTMTTTIIFCPKLISYEHLHTEQPIDLQYFHDKIWLLTYAWNLSACTKSPSQVRVVIGVTRKYEYRVYAQALQAKHKSYELLSVD